MEETNTAHVPVLLQEVIALLDVHPGETVLDCTLGGGGYATALLEAVGPHGRLVGIDADRDALARVEGRLQHYENKQLLCGNFRDAVSLLAQAGISSVDKIAFDLGLSSDQLTGASGRGFSFMADEPLHMTLGVPEDALLTATHVVNDWSERHLADVIFGFGGERHSRKIARAIVAAREETPIETSAQLATVVEGAIRARGKVHPATRTFQAIRMAVNDELGALAAGLEAVHALLAPNGRVAIVSFHSLEDGLVKRTFKTWSAEEFGTILTKKPLVPEHSEIRNNPRARSAKLRAFARST